MVPTSKILGPVQIPMFARWLELRGHAVRYHTNLVVGASGSNDTNRFFVNSEITVTRLSAKDGQCQPPEPEEQTAEPATLIDEAKIVNCQYDRAPRYPKDGVVDVASDVDETIRGKAGSPMDVCNDRLQAGPHPGAATVSASNVSGKAVATMPNTCSMLWNSPGARLA